MGPRATCTSLCHSNCFRSLRRHRSVQCRFSPPFRWGPQKKLRSLARRDAASPQQSWGPHIIFFSFAPRPALSPLCGLRSLARRDAASPQTSFGDPLYFINFISSTISDICISREPSTKIKSPSLISF